MKKTIWLAAGFAAMLFGNPAPNAHAEVNVQVSARHRPSFVIDRRPNFVNLRNQGFLVSVGSQYDIISYGNRYYIYQDGSWYRSSNYRGPWSYIQANSLPARIRRHNIDDIRRYRDTEYNRNNHRNNNRNEHRMDDNRR
jgi:hypothetical protein